MKAMGSRIREQRQKWEYTLAEVAEKVGVSKGTLSKLENGLLKRPPRHLIDKLANLFDCDPVYLLGYDDSPTVHLTYSAPGKENVTLLVEGKPIIGESGMRAALYKAAISVPTENIPVAIELLKSLTKKEGDSNAPQ